MKKILWTAIFSAFVLGAFSCGGNSAASPDLPSSASAATGDSLLVEFPDFSGGDSLTLFSSSSAEIFSSSDFSPSAGDSLLHDGQNPWGDSSGWVLDSGEIFPADPEFAYSSSDFSWRSSSVFEFSSSSSDAFSFAEEGFSSSRGESSSSEKSSSSDWSYSSGEYILGADISHFQEYEAAGYTFYDTDGEAKSIFEILRNHGFNYVRLKTFVSPQSAFGYAASGCEVANSFGNAAFAGKDSLVSYAKRVKAAGFGLLVDIHYSDNWADPGKQHVPYPWKDVSDADAMADSVYNYTYDLMEALKSAGATPDMVQVGNEITNGMIRHTPPTDCWGSDTLPLNLSVNGGMGSSQGIQNTAKYLKSGFAAVKAASPTTVTMAHIESPQNTATIDWWMNSIIQNQGVAFDVMGFSAYEAYGHGNPSAWKSLISHLSSTYPNLRFAIAEYNGGESDGSYGYDDARYETNEAMKNLGSVIGAFFWEPASGGAWGESLFTWNGKSLVASEKDFEEFDRFAREWGLL